MTPAAPHSRWQTTPPPPARSPAKPRWVRLRLTPAEHRALRILAAQEDATLQALLRTALHHYAHHRGLASPFSSPEPARPGEKARDTPQSGGPWTAGGAGPPSVT